MVVGFVGNTIHAYRVGHRVWLLGSSVSLDGSAGWIRPLRLRIVSRGFRSHGLCTTDVAFLQLYHFDGSIPIRHELLWNVCCKCHHNGDLLCFESSSVGCSPIGQLLGWRRIRA